MDHLNPVPANIVDAFRDFSGEAGTAGGTTAAAGGSGPDAGSLATMFEPPRQLLFHGSFDEAKGKAASEGRWLILNLQSSSQFASHQLNRDTWRDPMVSALVENNFILYQVYDVVKPDSDKLMHFYHVYELPALLIIDPVTGAPMKQWNGFVAADR